MTTSAVTRYVWQVVDVLLCDAVKAECFNFPTSDEDWSRLSDEFEAICGYPNCCLAIGGMLVEIERPTPWEVDLDDLVEADSMLEDDTDEEDMDQDSEDSDLDESMDEDITAQRDRIKEYLYVNRSHLLKRFG
ncbi:hypothetical protein PHPALM_28705 [Phytophthora palmivora]|uniref:Uncharacterized protein n=1 Tax=Phytophthora palmivora TaxID=4796 RepID=A0A2P4X9H3_9STRA|nr:hypothetical protein PHPALM_28705 [Phytophthora palmivora]